MTHHATFPLHSKAALVGLTTTVLLLAACASQNPTVGSKSNPISAERKSTMTYPSQPDRTAPVIADHRIVIHASREEVWKVHTDVAHWPTWQTDIQSASLDRPLEVGASFRWTTYNMAITSTVYALDDRARVLWGGDAGEIVGIHEWTFVDVPGGVEVRTVESFAGPAVAAESAKFQGLLDQSLVAWLERLKATAERGAL
jgi:uncharacterized membrane protein